MDREAAGYKTKGHKGLDSDVATMCYVTGCVSWEPRLTFLDFTNKLALGTYSWNGPPFVCRECPA